MSEKIKDDKTKLDVNKKAKIAVEVEKEDMDFVEMFRTKTDEADIASQLKTVFGGGYSKESVLEYFSSTRKNQQMMTETFKKNYQQLFDEKEKLKKANDTLQIRLGKVETDYANLSSSMQAFKIENKDITVEDILALRTSIAALEEEVRNKKNEISQMEVKASQLNHSIEDLENKLEQEKKESESLRELLLTEKRESKIQRDTVSDVSSQLESAKDEIKYWKALQTDGKKAELMDKVSKLTSNNEAQSETIKSLRTELELKDKSNTVLKSEVEVTKMTIVNQKTEIKSLTLQNDKLMVTNSVLVETMEQEYKKILEKITEKSALEVEKQIALRKLSDAEASISMLELELSGKKRVIEEKNVAKPEDVKEEANI